VTSADACIAARAAIEIVRGRVPTIAAITQRHRVRSCVCLGMRPILRRPGLVAVIPGISDAAGRSDALVPSFIGSSRPRAPLVGGEDERLAPRSQPSPILRGRGRTCGSKIRSQVTGEATNCARS
jgi:hypothetical protein